MLNPVYLILLIVAVNIGGTIQEENFESRILYGDDADIRDYPYQVAILYYGQRWCGGSIYSPYLIITAAHCVFDNDPLGFEIFTELTNFQERDFMKYRIQGYIAHEYYSPPSHLNDIAVMYPQTTIKFNQWAQPIPLAFSQVEPGTIAVVTGFGLNEYDQYPDNLRMAEVQILDGGVCNDIYGPSFDNSMICAVGQYDLKGTCYADSGGPLVVGGELIGIVSFGSQRCGELPGVFISIPYFYEWVRDKNDNMRTYYMEFND